MSLIVHDLFLCFQPFVKVVKNKAYFKTFQVKFRRRRGECFRVLHIIASLNTQLTC